MRNKNQFILCVITICSVLFIVICAIRIVSATTPEQCGERIYIERLMPDTEIPTTENPVETTMYYTDQDAEILAKVLWRECGNVKSMTEQACVAWTVLNRVDFYGKSVYDIASEPHQFVYVENTPIHEKVLALAYDVLDRWNFEKNGFGEDGRVLPKEYMHFKGDGSHNYFRNAYNYPYDIWDYSYDSPYDN